MDLRLTWPPTVIVVPSLGGSQTLQIGRFLLVVDQGSAGATAAVAADAVVVKLDHDALSIFEDTDSA